MATAPVDITNRGTFISAADAKANLAEYFNDEGKPQPNQSDPAHVFGHVFGLAKIKELIAKIDQHNLNQTDAKQQINGLRIYHSKTGLTRDVLIVPVTRDSDDYPDTIHTATAMRASAAPAGGTMILSGGRPCPNQCNG